jgi:hypothetical protein
VALGLNPYDREVWNPLRAEYGSTWFPNPVCAYPLWTVMFFTPLSLLSPQQAGALWMTLCELALLFGVILLVRALRWHEGRRYLPLIFAGIALFRPIYPAIANGQLSPVLFFLLAASLAAHRSGHRVCAGLLLALQVTKPNLAVLFIPTAGLIFLVRRDWKTLGGFVAGGLGLLAISWCVRPGWPWKWLSISSKAQVARITPTAWGMAYDIGGPRHGLALACLIVAVACLGLLITVFKQRHQDWLLSMGLALCASTFVTPYLWAYEQLVLLLPAIVGLYWGTSSRPQQRWIWQVSWVVVIIGLSWALAGIATSRGIDTWSAFVPLAIAAYLCLAWWKTRATAMSTPPPVREGRSKP